MDKSVSLHTKASQAASFRRWGRRIKRIGVMLACCCMVAGLPGCQKPAQVESSTVSENSPAESSVEESRQDNTMIQTMTQGAYFDLMSFKDSLYFMLHEPMRETETPAPLIIFLHGLGDNINLSYFGTADPLVRTLERLEREDEAYGNYMLVPITPTSSQGWWTDEQLVALKALILTAINHYQIDPKRVYISGISMGGFTTCQLVSEMQPDTFAAAVPLSGAYNMRDPGSLENTAFRIYHSQNDAVVNVQCSRDLYNQLIQSGHQKAEYFERANGDHIAPLYWAFTETDRAFYDWLFAQRLP